MKIHFNFVVRGISLAAISSALAVSAQEATNPVPTPEICENRPGAPQWLPCGPDRTFSGTEARALFFKEGLVTKLIYTSGKSGRKFFAYFKSDGKLDSGPEGGHNIGKSWKFKGDNVCRDYYQSSTVHCGMFELQGINLYLVGDDGNRSVVNSLEFTRP